MTVWVLVHKVYYESTLVLGVFRSKAAGMKEFHTAVRECLDDIVTSDGVAEDTVWAGSANEVVVLRQYKVEG